MTSKRRAALLVPVLAAIAAFVGWDYWKPAATPAGQPPLAAMRLEEFRNQFNQSSDCVRVVALLSPT